MDEEESDDGHGNDDFRWCQWWCQWWRCEACIVFKWQQGSGSSSSSSGSQVARVAAKRVARQEKALLLLFLLLLFVVVTIISIILFVLVVVVVLSGGNFFVPQTGPSVKSPPCETKHCQVKVGKEGISVIVPDFSFCTFCCFFCRAAFLLRLPPRQWRASLPHPQTQATRRWCCFCFCFCCCHWWRQRSNRGNSSSSSSFGGNSSSGFSGDDNGGGEKKGCSDDESRLATHQPSPGKPTGSEATTSAAAAATSYRRCLLPYLSLLSSLCPCHLFFFFVILVWCGVLRGVHRIDQRRRQQRKHLTNLLLLLIGSTAASAARQLHPAAARRGVCQARSPDEGSAGSKKRERKAQHGIVTLIIRERKRHTTA
jgi:hypothetical protein